MLQNNEIDFDSIKARISISDVLGKYTHVPNRRRYRIPCVLHNGDGPNLSVDDDKGLFHCFTCGQGGDVVALYAALENLTIGEAARRLSQDYQIESKPIANFRRVVKDLEEYKQKETEQPTVDLPICRPLQGYRRYSQEAIKHFDLRLVDDGVLLPLKDREGRLVGYSIRQINRLPKYKNHPYGLKKAELLYGLFENQQAIKETKTVILTEGQFDTVRVWDAGYRNVASSMGAGLSPEQARLLMPLVSTIIVLYDGDKTGREKAVELKETFGSLFKIEIKDLPDGTDPDTADLRAILE